MSFNDLAIIQLLAFTPAFLVMLILSKWRYLTLFYRLQGSRVLLG